MKAALFSNLPIDKLDDVRQGMKRLGIDIKVRYRGSRSTPADRKRSPISRSTTCLKQNAKTFSVYPL
jgi:ribosomal protein S10